MFIHHLVFASPLMELSLVNIQLQYKEDWDQVIGAIDFSLSVALNLFQGQFAQH